MSSPTPSQTVGPFFGVGLGPVETEGAIRVEGQVLDGAGEPVPDALLEFFGSGQAGKQFGRCRTDDEGAFHFTAPEAPYLEITVFARGLLRHLNTRMYLPGHEAKIPAGVEPARRETLVARREGEVLRFDVRLQGAGETVFFI